LNIIHINRIIDIIIIIIVIIINKNKHIEIIVIQRMADNDNTPDKSSQKFPEINIELQTHLL
jgi:hypothetical protein